MIDLAKRAGQWRGWSSDTFELYGEKAVKKYKTFLATRSPAGWRVYFCTETEASVADILGVVADRFSLEITFRACKQVVGAEQPVRFLGANVGAVHVGRWTCTPTEAWAWGREAEGLVDRSTSPRGTGHHGGRATRTSGGRGAVNCGARSFVRFYTRGCPKQKFRPRPTGCSAWPHNMYIHPESTAW